MTAKKRTKKAGQRQGKEKQSKARQGKATKKALKDSKNKNGAHDVFYKDLHKTNANIESFAV